MLNIKNNSNETQEDYIKYVTDVINRLILENRIHISKETIDDNKEQLKLKLTHTEWYNELDDDTKYNVEMTLQKHFINNIKNYIEKQEDGTANKRQRIE